MKIFDEIFNTLCKKNVESTLYLEETSEQVEINGIPSLSTDSCPFALYTGSF